MSKSINLKDDVHIDSDSISHDKTKLSILLNNRITKTVLYSNVPSVGEIGKLSVPGSSHTISDKFSNYDFLVIRFRSRVWGWCIKEEVIFNSGQFGGSNVQTGNLYSMIMPLYNSNTFASMQYYFTNNNTISVYYNTHYTGDNHLYIGGIFGYKIMSK